MRLNFCKQYCVAFAWDSNQIATGLAWVRVEIFLLILKLDIHKERIYSHNTHSYSLDSIV
jgi:hypothetical protein